MSCRSLRFNGDVKYSGIESGNSPWKTGSLEISNRAGSWFCYLYFSSTSDSKPARSYEIATKKIDQVIFKTRFLLQLKNGVHIHFRPKLSGTMEKLKSVIDEIIGENSGDNILLKTPEKIAKRNKTPSKIVPLLFNGTSTPHIDLQNSENIDVTPNSQNKRLVNGVNSEDDRFDIFEESKENQYSGPADPITPEQFLKRGSEKSRETLKSLSTGGFYSGSKVGSQLFTSSLSSKRSLGFMPDPTPVKRFRLSDCTYSWIKNKSSPKVETNNKINSLHGFSNLGNTCYMNATLQSLFGLDTFSTDLLYTNQHLMKSLSHDSLYYHLARLLKARKNTALPDSVKHDILRNVKRAISTSAKRFSGYQQHDAHEFLGQVLDQLKEEVIKIEKSKQASPPKETNNSDRLANPEFINPTVQNFEFEVLHTIRCVRCGEEVEKLENFNDLSLDMPKRFNGMNQKSIQDALNIFLDEEEIDYNCSKCNHNKSEVRHRFSTLPRILVLQLKRNCYDSTAFKNGKVIRSIHIPKFLSLGHFCSDETVPCNTAPEIVPNFRFKKRSTRSDGISRLDDDDATPLVDDWDGSNKDKAEEDDIARAIELSLAQQKEKSCETGETEEDQLEKVLEMSLREDHRNNSTDMTDFCNNKELAKLTEEERIDLAIQQSLIQAEQEYESKFNQTDEDSCRSDLLDEVDLQCLEDKENLLDDNDVCCNENRSSNVDQYSCKKFESEKDFPFSSYRLVSIVNHIGISSETGHYISDVFDMKKQSWMSFDDSRVTSLTESEVCCRREKSGYIFFYMNKIVFEEMLNMYTMSDLTDKS